MAELQKLATYCLDVAVVVGHPYREGRTRYNAASLLRHGRIEQIYFKQRLPNYQVFDEKRYFEPGNRPCVFEIDGRRIGAHHLRGPVVPGAGRPGQGRGRAAAAVDQRLALPPQQARRALPGDRRAREGDGAARALRALDRRAGRAGVRRRLVRARRRGRAHLPGARRSAKRSTSWSSKATPRAARSRPPLTEEEMIYRALMTGVRDYVEQEPLPRRDARALGRHRFRAGARDLRGRARRGARARRDDAFGLHRADEPRGRARDGEDPRRAVRRDRHQADVRRLPRRSWRRSFEGRAEDHDRGEPPVAHPRHAADGAVQQVRLDRRHHRQQERDGHRLRHALRRHGRRLRGDQGHREDAGLPHLQLAQLQGPRDPAARDRPRALARSCGPARPTRTRCRPTRCSTPWSSATWSAT